MSENTPDLQKPVKFNASFSIWPPTQRTRDAVTNRLIETLSSPTVLSKRYGTIPEAEAAETARHIEEEAFAAASAAASSDDDGIEILQVYSKEISKRMLETIKTRSRLASEPSPKAAAASTTISEQIESVKNEPN